MDALIAASVAAHPKTPAPRVVSELAAVLAAFPSGLSDAVLETQLYSALTLNAQRAGPARGRGSSKHAGGGADDALDARPQADNRAPQTMGRRRPAWWWTHGGSLKVTPLSEAIRGGGGNGSDGSGGGDGDGAAQRHVCLHAEVVAAPSQQAAAPWPPCHAPNAACSAPVLYLSDDDGVNNPNGGGAMSAARAPALFVHSSQLPLVGGPLLAPGTLVRVATTVLPTLPASHAHMPKLMPTAALVVEVPAASWPQQLASAFVGCCSGGAQPPIVGLKAALAAAATSAATAAAAGPRGVDGWLMMRVARIGPAEPGAQWGANVARAVGVDCASGDAEMEVDGGAGGAAAAAGVAPAAVLVLRGEQQAALGDLLRPGEEVAVFGAATCLMAQQAAPVLLLGDRALVAVRRPARPLGGELAAQEQEQQQQPQCTVLPPLTAALQPGGRDLVVSGAVRGLRVAAGGRRLQCRLAPLGAAASGGGVPLSMHLDGGPRGKTLLSRLLDGHALLLIGARSEPCDEGRQQQQQQQVDTEQKQSHSSGGGGARLEWDAALPGAEAHDVSCLPALLTTPALQTGLAARAVADLVAARPAGGLAIVEACVARASPSVVRVHSVCGRVVSRASLGLGDFGDLMDDDDEADGLEEVDKGDGADQGGGGADGHNGGAAAAACADFSGLWSCAFCGAEVGTAETELGWSGSMALRQDTGGDPACCTLDVEPSAWRTLLPFTPEQARHNAAVSAGAAAVLEGRRIRACLVFGEDDGAASPATLTVTQALLL